MTQRQSDDGYQKRKVFDIKTIIVIMTALFGSSGITGLTSYLTDPNIELQTKVNTVESTLEMRTMRTENYIKAHDEETQLKQQLIDKEFEHIKELLLEIKADVKVIKNNK